MSIGENRVRVVANSIQQIGYISRRTPKKREHLLVQDFLEKWIPNIRLSPKMKVTIFMEPAIDTGYPDIIIVKHRDPSSITWNSYAKKLSKKHYKVLFEIAQRPHISKVKLANMLGFSENEIDTILEKLQAARLVLIQGDVVSRIEKSKYYCIESIIAIEAKIVKWSDALNQALQNTCFASESFILLPKDKCTDLMRERCQDQGVGIILLNGNKVTQALKPIKHNTPRSYISYLFNDWIIKLEAMEN